MVGLNPKDALSFAFNSFLATLSNFSLTTKFSVNGDTDTLYQFNSSNTPLADYSGDVTLCAVNKLEPTTASQARNIYSFQLHMDGTLGDDFELNDITIVYRLKGSR